jgi:glycosyltransferase involved in cell wall biosynthesis
MTTVVVDVRTSSRTGIWRYGASLLGALGSALDERGIDVVGVLDPQQLPILHSTARTSPDAPPSETKLVTMPSPAGFVWHDSRLRMLIADLAPDLYVTTHHSVDPELPVPFVHTVHDLTRLRFPAYSYSDDAFARRFGAWELVLVRREYERLRDWDPSAADVAHGEAFTRYFRALNRYLAGHARRVLTVSRHSAADIADLLSVPANRIDIVGGAVDQRVFGPRDPHRVRRVLRELNIGQPYCLFTGLVHPHKRYEWLLAALHDAWTRMPAGACVVVTGGEAERSSMSDGGYGGAFRQDVRMVGRVPDNILACLYSGAAAVVMATVNEGSSLAGMEALACGCEVVCPEIGPLREALGDAAHYYQPGSDTQLTALVAQALSGTLARRAAGFQPPSWCDSAQVFAASVLRALEPDHAAVPAGGAGR